MYTLLKPFSVREILLKMGVRIFSGGEFSRIFSVPRYKAKRYLERWAKEGFLIRLKQGLYALKSDLPGEEAIANRLYKPSYLSFEYALAYYNILPEIPYTVTSATTKSTRTFAVDAKIFSYFKIQRRAYIGYSLIRVGEEPILIAGPEKALVDYLYFVALGKKPFNERLSISRLDKKEILKYAKLYKRPKLNELLKQLL